MSQKRAKALRKAAMRSGINVDAPREYHDVETKTIVGMRRTDKGPEQIKAKLAAKGV